MTCHLLCLFPVTDMAWLVFMVKAGRARVRVTVSCRSGVSTTSFKDVNDFLCSERRSGR